MKVVYLTIIICLALVLFFLLAYLLTGYFLSNLFLGRKGRFRKKLEKEDILLENEKITFFNDTAIQEISLQSKDGLKLNGFYKNENKEYLIIFLHDYGRNHFQTYDYIKLCQQYIDFDFLTIDLRSHGDSEGNMITLGEKESEDLSLWISKMLSYNEKYKIILYGLSLGAMAIGLLDDFSMQNVCALILDSAFDSAENELKYIFNLIKIKSKIFFNSFINFLTKNQKINVKKCNLINKINNKKLPIIIFHAINDNFVPNKMAYNLYNSLPEKSRHIAIFNNSQHCKSITENRFYYKEELEKFLKIIKNTK